MTENNVTSATRSVDVGCGIGGSSRHIARKFGCKTSGVTLSPYQAKRGNELAQEQGVSGLCDFRVADALDMPFRSNTFDLVWSLESGEHMPDKRQFVRELVRIAAPGGRIIIVTWCHRDLNADELKLTDTVYDPEVHFEEVQRKWWGISITHASGRHEFIDLMDDWSAPDPYHAAVRR